MTLVPRAIALVTALSAFGCSRASHTEGRTEYFTRFTDLDNALSRMCTHSTILSRRDLGAPHERQMYFRARCELSAEYGAGVLRWSAYANQGELTENHDPEVCFLRIVAEHLDHPLTLDFLPMLFRDPATATRARAAIGDVDHQDGYIGWTTVDRVRIFLEEDAPKDGSAFDLWIDGCSRREASSDPGDMGWFQQVLGHEQPGDSQ